jgi:CBS domain-containing protein
MNIASLLQPALVLRSDAATWDSMADTLIRAINKTGDVPLSTDEIRFAVQHRERLRDTVLPTGLAVPHTRLKAFSDLIVAVGIPRTPIPSGTYPIRMMVLFLLDAARDTNLYLNCLAGFAKISTNEELFQKLIATDSAEDFISLLKKQKIEVTKELTVGQIMNASPIVIHKDNTLKEAIELMFQSRVGFLPVVDKDRHLAGRLSLLDLYDECIPDAVKSMVSIGFTRNFNPLAALEAQKNKKVAEVMDAADAAVNIDATVAEALLLIVKKRRHHIPVLKDGVLVGVLSYTDILQKVIQS